tara:strand:+ start:8150 stop:9055 length:906 start_codon:yes stop_codon:yes gene_type:complete
MEAIKPNPNNPLGLLNYHGQLFQLVSYFFYDNLLEIRADSVCSDNSLTEYFYKFGDNAISIEPSLAEILEKTQHQLSIYFPMTYHQYKVFSLNGHYCLLFKVYEDTVSMRDLKNIPKQYQQAMCDYYTANELLPLLVTDNRFHSIYEKKTSDPNSEFYANEPLNYQKASSLLIENQVAQQNRNKTRWDLMKEREAAKEYNTILQNERQISALLKGGFVEVEYKDKVYSVPKIIIMAMKDPKFTGDSYVWGKYTWFFDYCISETKNSMISDLFLISDLPIKNINDPNWLSSFIEKAYEELDL